MLAVLACGGNPTTPRPTPSPSPSASSSPAPSPSSVAAGPLRFRVGSVATGLTAPWAIAFAPDGSLWFTERPGRVRVVRNGRLLAAPALTLNVSQQPGCEGGLLGLAFQGAYAFVFYTYAGGAGNVNRLSRFAVSGNTLTGEKVLLDRIPGGSCYHDGGRLKLGPDGYLYVSTGDTFQAYRAATPTGLNGKILRIRPDGGGEEMFAWGFRNPQGLAFDARGRLYASMNGPTGDLLPCCHDAVYLVQQGGFHGWPWYAANTPTGYSGGGRPASYVHPVAESGSSATWAPSGITFFSSPGRGPVLLVAELRGSAIRLIAIDPDDPHRVVSQRIVLSGFGRMRDIVQGPDGCAYALTSNNDGRGTPGPQDDRVLRLCPV